MNKQLYSYEIKVKTNWIVVFGLIPWLLLDMAALSFIGYGLIFDSHRVGDFWPFWILFFIAGVFVLNVILWNLRGKEKISVTEKGITIKKTGKLFSSLNNIAVHELESVECDHDTETPWKLKFWQIRGGPIIINYLGTNKRLGPSLEVKAAEKIVLEIREALTKLPNEN